MREARELAALEKLKRRNLWCCAGRAALREAMLREVVSGVRFQAPLRGMISARRVGDNSVDLRRARCCLREALLAVVVACVP